MSEKNTEKLLIYNSRKQSSGTIWLLFLFLGWSYGSLGSIAKQIFYYLTFGGFGLWAIYRLITLNSAIKKYNKKIAIEIGLSADEILKLGL